MHRASRAGNRNAQAGPEPSDPLMLPQLADPVATQVGTAVSVMPDGRLSVTVTLVASAGPLFVTVIE